jgi:hypothetical protein
MNTMLFLISLLIVQSEGFVPVANVTELMQTFVIPSSNELFNVGLEPPDSDDSWLTVETNALILAESGNLLMLPERSEGRQGWVDAARDMNAAGQRALEAARARNADEEAWFEIGDQILEACSSCHDAYWLVN